MNRFVSITKPLMWFTALLLAALTAGCGGGGGQGAILGAPVALAPTVTAVSPLPNATGVATNTTVITAAFSTAMDPATLTASSFTLACPVGTPFTGMVSYQATGNVASLTLPVGTLLPAGTVCTATITTAAKDTAGIALASNFVWTFTTGLVADTTLPRVTVTVPATTVPGPTTGVATNTAITATFTEDMTPSTFTGSSFTLTGPGLTPVAGNVSYTVGSRTAVFTPSTPTTLAAGTTYTATITTAVTDLAGNALAGNQAPLPAASNYVWTFTTAAAADTIPPTVTSVNPLNLSTGVCLNKTVNATFSEAMDPLTITTGTFTLQLSGPPLGPVLGGTVVYDTVTNIATLTPSLALLANTNYTATVTTGVKDLAGNALVSNKVWSFTTGTQVCSPIAPIALGVAAPFGNLGGTAGTTNQGTLTVINGDIGTTATVTSAVTGFHDAFDIYTETGSNIGLVNGLIYTCTISTTGPNSVTPNAANCTTATNALAAAQTTYNSLTPASLPGGTDPGAGQLGGLTLAPGVYQAAGGSFMITGSDLTLDGQGDANAVWVFQTASSLTVGGPGAPRTIHLINGAAAKNVFWQVGSSATINAAGGGTMVGTVLANAGVSFSTVGNVAIVTLNGRAVGLNASVTMTDTVINVPAP
ncbi:MAG: Ig-like domain-containing protein [Sulfuriferula sp.]